MVRILLRFSEEQVAQPIASEIIIQFKVPMAILSAHMNSKGGEILAEIPDEQQEKIVAAFIHRKINRQKQQQIRHLSADRQISEQADIDAEQDDNS